MIKNENLKILSCRIDPETIVLIDQFVQKHYYWKRNTVICKVLWAVLHDFTDDEVYEMVRRNKFRQESVEAKYRINKLPVQPIVPQD